MAYVDGFLLIVPTDKIDAYKKISTKAGKVWASTGRSSIANASETIST